MADRTALIVGASRGLGLGLVRAHLERGWRVVGTVRAGREGELPTLAAAGDGRLQVETVDIADAGQVAALAERLQGRTLDLLFVNAGVSGAPDTPVGRLPTEVFVETMLTNALGPMRVIEACERLLAPGAPVAAMSSGLGSIGENDTGGWETYRMSKAALDMGLKSYAARARDRAVLALSPGWVRTDMGGPGAPLSVEEAAGALAELIERERGRPGARFLNWRGRTLDW
jgi:NAD(P)-dependent dehydrogenase (short-subunit alcohol dehydrogenase family)